MVINKENRISPCCGSEIKIIGLDPEFPETYLTDVSPNWVLWYECKKCNKKFKNLVTEKEYINISRTKLIDKILNE